VVAGVLGGILLDNDVLHEVVPLLKVEDFYRDNHQVIYRAIRDLYDAEKQILTALPKMAEAASHAELRKAFEMHLRQTEGQVTRLEKIFEALGEQPTGKKCVAMAGLIKEGDELMKEGLEPDVLDAALIGAAQKVEHYEMAGYGTVRAYARLLKEKASLKLIEQTLAEEKAADKKLSGLAEAGINQGAADAAHPDDDEDLVSAAASRTSKRSAKPGRR